MATATATQFITLGQAARRFGVADWTVRRVIARGFLREPERVGQNRVFNVKDLPLIQAALVRAGYLPEGPVGGR